MKQSIFTVSENTPVARGVFRMTLAGDVSEIVRPGQFVNIRLEGFFLRRPISVCDLGEDSLTIIYKAVGRGTAAMAAMGAGEKLDVLTGLGNGYDTSKSGLRPLLVAGGVGAPPMYLLARRLIAEGKRPRAVLGFNSAADVFLVRELEALGVPTAVATVDGTAGRRGMVTDLMAEERESTYVFTCGPEPMLKAVWSACATSGQFSFEERMGCGFGACMGCTCKTKYGSKRICKDGPVLEKEEIIW